MTRRERLMATLRGEPVDRPAVSFYEVGGYVIDRQSTDPFCVYNAPSWQPLLDLAYNETDLIRMGGARLTKSANNCWGEYFTTETWQEGSSRFLRTTLKVAGRTMSSLTRRDAEIDTVWTLEHLLKSSEDAQAYLQVPDEAFANEAHVDNLLAEETKVGDNGIMMMNIGDPLCDVASLFSMQDYILIASIEPDLFHALLEKQARQTYPIAETVARDFPGRLWRVVGPEYACEPYLPPYLFEEYVVKYTKPIVDSIQRYGGFARIHCHGRLRNTIGYIAQLGGCALDPIEPPPQGDVQLIDIRREYGKDMVLFGNLEIADIENMPPNEFEKVVARALREGTEGQGRGFVLMPTAAPYGRTITDTTLKNYETMVRLTTSFS